MKMKSLPIMLIMFFCAFSSCKKDIDKNNDTIIEAIFESDRQELSAGDSIIFKDFSKGYVDKWKWTFEGGTPAASALSSPVVRYNTPGLYSVTVELSNSHNQTVLSKKGYLKVDYNQVKADFSASAAVSYTGQTVSFKDSSIGGGESWFWEFIPVSGGTTLSSTLQNPSMVFTDTGFYNVSLTASNPAYSNKETKINFIRIIDINAVSADFGSDESATYDGGSINFTDHSLGYIVSWDWKIEGPVTLSSQEQNPVINFTAPGRYKVSLTVSNGTKSITKSIDNYILVIPSDKLAAFFSFNGNINDIGPNNIPTSLFGSGLHFSGEDRNGQVGKSATFDGASGITADDHSACNFGANDYTIACWVKTSVTSRMMVWQESGKKGAGDNQTWLRLGDNTNDRLMRLAIEDATGSAILNLGAPAKVTDGTWHNVVAVRQGTLTSVYVDGVKIGSLTASGLKVVSNDEDFKIGMQEGATSNSSFFNGEIDDLIIYNKALTDAEVLQLFNL